MQVIIRNFTEADSVTVASRPAHSIIPATVMLAQDSGSLHFQFNMLPEQAIQMAQALLQAAEHSETAQATD